MTRVTGSASEVSYKAMTADNISGAHREYKSTLEDIGGFTLMDRDDDTTFVNKHKIKALAIGDQSEKRSAGSAGEEQERLEMPRVVVSNLRLTNVEDIMASSSLLPAISANKENGFQ